MLLSVRRLPLPKMARKFRLSYRVLPVLLFALAAASRPDVSATLNRNATSADIAAALRTNSSVTTRYQNVQYLSGNASAADASRRLQFPNTDNGSTADAGCKNCGGVKLPPKKGSLEYTIRIEMIKRQILDRLRMEKEPKFKRPRIPIPTPLENSNFLESSKPDGQQEPDREANKVSQVIVIGMKVASAANKQLPKKARKQIFEFRFPKKIYTKTIASAMLWVYKSKKNALQMGDHTLRFDDAAPKTAAQQGSGNNGQQRTVSKKRLTNTDQEWVSINVLGTVHHWVDNALKESTANHTNYVHRLEVSCPDCPSVTTDFIATRGRYKPFITLALANENSRPRRKRAVNCRPGMKECCRQEFYVSFKEMGWNNWIMAPKGFNANYCSGSCFGHILPVYHHTAVLQKVAVLRKQSELSPCCSPTKMFGLSLIYFDKDENLFHENVPQMVVEECGCS